jgi:hypothetical protein
VDESGDHSLLSIDPKYPIFVLSFCIFQKEHYAKDVIPMLKLLKLNTFGHDLVILHESDIRKKRGSFAQLSKELRENFLNQLSCLIESFDFKLIAIVINKQEYLQNFNKPEHTYHLALRLGLESLHYFLKDNHQLDKTVHIICEARGKKEDNELELAFRKICKESNSASKTLNFDILLADKKSNSEGLQIADLVARPIGLSVIKPTQLNRSFEIVKNKFFIGDHNHISENGRKIFP